MAGSVNLGTVHVSLEMRLQKMKDGIRDAKRDLTGFENSLKKTAEVTQSIGRKMSIGLTLPLVAAGKVAVETAVRFDSLKRGLIAVEGSAAEAEKSLKKLKEVAKLPGLGLEEAQQGYINLRAVKLNGDLATRSLMAFGNALATVGKGKAELDGVNLALTQIVSKGKVSAEEINQIAERVPQIRAAMQAAFGTADTEALQKMKLGPEQFIAGIVAEFEKLPKVTGGAQNAFENFSDSVKEFHQSVGNALLPTLTRAMDALGPKIQQATQWFNGLSESSKDVFAGITIAVAGTGPLLVGLGLLATAVERIVTAFKAIAASSAFKFFMNPAGLVAAGVGAAFMAERTLQGFIEQGRQNFAKQFKAETPAEKRARLESEVKRLGRSLQQEGMGAPWYARQQGQYDAARRELAIMKGIPGGMLSVGDPALQPSTGPRRPGPPMPVDKSAIRKQRDLVSANLDALADLGSEEARIMREAQRMRNRGIKESTVQLFIRQSMAPILKRRNEIVMGNVLRQGREEVSSIPKASGDIPSLMGLRNLPTGGGESPWQKFGNWLQNRPPNIAPAQEGMSVLSAAAMGAGMAPKAMKPREIEKAALPTIKELGFNLGQEFGNNMAHEMGRAFGDMFEKVFGSGNPLSRALSRTFSRLVDDLMFSLISRGIGNKLMVGLFGGGGGMAAGAAGAIGGAALAGGGGAAAGGAAGVGMAGAGKVGAAASASGAIAGGLFALAFAGAAAWGISRLLQGKGRYSLESAAAKVFPGTGKLGIASMAGTGIGVGVGNPLFQVQFYNSNFNNGMDPVRTADTLAWHTQQKMRSRAGGFRSG